MCVCMCVLVLDDVSVCTYHKLYCCLAVVTVNDIVSFVLLKCLVFGSNWYAEYWKLLLFYFVCRTSWEDCELWIVITVTSGNMSHINQGWKFPCAARYYATNSAVLHNCTDPSFCTFRSRVGNKIESDCTSRLMQEKKHWRTKGGMLL
jgi:hypothetical protein